jgi:hypothetical protein
LQRFTKLAFWATEPQSSKDRLEIKFVVPGRMLSDARLRVLLHPLGFASAYPPRQINNVYFDTPELDALNMNEEGVPDRVKVRVRWYGEIKYMTQPILEFKIKSGLAGRKVQSPLGSDFDMADTRWATLIRSVQRSLPPSMLHCIGFTSCPTLLNTYQREYYQTSDAAIRVTIDHKVRSFDQRFTSGPNWTRPDFGPDLVIVEFKASMTCEEALRRATSAFGWRISRHSKYSQGLAPE